MHEAKTAAETRGSGRQTRRNSTAAAQAKSNDRPQPAAGLQILPVRLPADLIREIDGLAKRTGVSRSDALRDCLAVGLETIRAREGVPGGRVEELLGALEAVRVAVDLVGPPTYGLLRLVAHWATRDGGVRVNEDELLAEVRAVGADEWEQAVADAERAVGEQAKASGGSEAN
jgi:hypothetical protein